MKDNNDIDTRLWDHYLTDVNNYEESGEEPSVTEIEEGVKDTESITIAPLESPSRQ
jgi:hypothetical protein